MMNRKLVKQVILSNRSFLSIAKLLNCTVDDLIEKFFGNQEFDTEEINFLIRYIPLRNPIEIFFDNYVSEMET